LFNASNNVVPGGWWALVAVAALVVVLAVVTLTRLGPVRRAQRRPGGVLAGVTLPRLGPVRRSQRRRGGLLASGTGLTAGERRARAAGYASAGNFELAMIEALRAIASGLEERGGLVPDPGRTADELAAQAGRLMPAQAAALAGAARSFDDVCYGGQPGSRAGYEQLRDLDTALLATTPSSV